MDISLCQVRVRVSQPKLHFPLTTLNECAVFVKLAFNNKSNPPVQIVQWYCLYGKMMGAEVVGK